VNTPFKLNRFNVWVINPDYTEDGKDWTMRDLWEAYPCPDCSPSTRPHPQEQTNHHNQTHLQLHLPL
jgi:hypothetical protein